MKIKKVKGQVDIIINRESGTVIRCHNRRKIDIANLIQNKTALNHDQRKLRTKIL